MTDRSHTERLARYYRWHAPWYDLTRPWFLFGRRTLLDLLPALPHKPRITEVGCGTGSNLVRLAERWPRARITGIDLSGAMLCRAERKTRDLPNVTLRRERYGTVEGAERPADLVLFSYSLAMTGEDTGQVLDQALKDMRPGGILAAVDFHRTPSTLFRRWMRRNHVTMEGNLLDRLSDRFDPIITRERAAYGGLWYYTQFLGRRNEAKL